MAHNNAVERTPEKRLWCFAVTLIAGTAHCKRYL